MCKKAQYRVCGKALLFLQEREDNGKNRTGGQYAKCGLNGEQKTQSDTQQC